MTIAEKEKTALPHTDTKAIGHADFYFATNATFRFIKQRHGMEGLKRYWLDIGREYYRPVSDRWLERGMGGVSEYWSAFFRAEPGAEVEVSELQDEVRLEVKACPLIRHLREHGRDIVPEFCQHCYFVSEAIAEPAGLTVRVCGGNGSCTQRFVKRHAAPPPQNLEEITIAS